MVTKEWATLVSDMREAGWSLQTTSRGHIKALAPDGITMQVFGGHHSKNRGIKNARSLFERWLRAQQPVTRLEEATVAETETEIISAPLKSWERRCDQCNIVIDAREKNHRAWQSHSLMHMREIKVPCPECDYVGTKQSMPSHTRYNHSGPPLEDESPWEPEDELEEEPRHASRFDPPLAVTEYVPPIPSSIEVSPNGKSDHSDTLDSIIEDLLSLTTRVERYRNEQNELRETLRKMLR